MGQGLPPFQVTYDEGVKVGYKWYDAEKKPVLFPFGFGLSYTTYRLLRAEGNSGDKVKVTFTLTNTGARAGAEIAEVYAALPASPEEPPKRLVGWSKVELEAGEKQAGHGRNRAASISPSSTKTRTIGRWCPATTRSWWAARDKLPLKATLTLK